MDMQPYSESDPGLYGENNWVMSSENTGTLLILAIEGQTAQWNQAWAQQGCLESYLRIEMSVVLLAGRRPVLQLPMIPEILTPASADAQLGILMIL